MYPEFENGERKNFVLDFNLDGKKLKAEIVNNICETSELIIKEYLIKVGYMLLKEVKIG